MQLRIGFLLLIFTIVSCEKDNNHSDLIIHKFPMEVGTTWVYDWVTITKHLESYNSNRVVKIDTTKMRSITWIESDTTLFDTLDVKVFRYENSAVSHENIIRQFCYLTEDGLWLSYSYEDINKYNAFYKQVALPLNWKSSWNPSMNSEGSYRKVVSQVDFELNGNIYECYKVKSYNQDLNIGEIYCWYSEIGLVKQELLSMSASSSSTYPGSNDSHPVLIDKYITLVDFY